MKRRQAIVAGGIVLAGCMSPEENTEEETEEPEFTKTREEAVEELEGEIEMLEWRFHEGRFQVIVLEGRDMEEVVMACVDAFWHVEVDGCQVGAVNLGGEMVEEYWVSYDMIERYHEGQIGQERLMDVADQG